MCRECLGKIRTGKRWQLGKRCSEGKWGSKDNMIGGLVLDRETDLPPLEGVSNLGAVAKLAAVVLTDSLDIITGKVPRKGKGINRDPEWERGWWKTNGPRIWLELLQSHPNESMRMDIGPEEAREKVSKLRN